MRAQPTSTSAPKVAFTWNVSGGQLLLKTSHEELTVHLAYLDRKCVMYNIRMPGESSERPYTFWLYEKNLTLHRSIATTYFSISVYQALRKLARALIRAHRGDRAQPAVSFYDRKLNITMVTTEEIEFDYEGPPVCRLFYTRDAIRECFDAESDVLAFDPRFALLCECIWPALCPEEEPHPDSIE